MAHPRRGELLRPDRACQDGGHSSPPRTCARPRTARSTSPAPSRDRRSDEHLPCFRAYSFAFSPDFSHASCCRSQTRPDRQRPQLLCHLFFLLGKEGRELRCSAKPGDYASLTEVLAGQAACWGLPLRVQPGCLDFTSAFSHMGTHRPREVRRKEISCPSARPRGCRRQQRPGFSSERRDAAERAQPLPPCGSWWNATPHNTVTIHPTRSAVDREGEAPDGSTLGLSSRVVEVQGFGRIGRGGLMARRSFRRPKSRGCCSS